MGAYVYRNLRGQMVADEDTDAVPLRLKFTHVMSRARNGFRVHRITEAQSMLHKWDPERRHMHAKTRCHMTFFEGRGILGTAESLTAAGGVLCPRCHPCRCATPCNPQCVCSTTCRECSPGRDGRCALTPSREAVAS